MQAMLDKQRPENTRVLEWNSKVQVGVEKQISQGRQGQQDQQMNDWEVTGDGKAGLLVLRRIIGPHR